MPHLDHAVGRVDAQVRRHPNRTPGRGVHDGEEERVRASGRPLDPRTVRVEVGERADRQVRPHAPGRVKLVGVVEVGGVAFRVERLEPARLPSHRGMIRAWARHPPGHGCPHWPVAGRLVALVHRPIIATRDAAPTPQWHGQRRTLARMDTRTERPVAIVAGGGIGGLVAALCLEEAGIHAVVYEAAREIRALGVGINLLPHAVRALSALGLADRLATTGVATTDLRYFTKRGEPIWSEPRGVDAGYRWPQYSIHRGELQMLLLEAVRPRLGHGRVVTGHRLTGFTQGPDGVEVHFTDRNNGDTPVTVHGDLLVGADGIQIGRAHV